MRRFVVTALCVLGTAGAAHAQAQAQPRTPPPMQVTVEETPRFAYYWEAGGNAVFTGNFDVLITEHTSVRVGGLGLPMPDGSEPPWAAVLTINHLFGSCGHFLEVGAGWVALHRWGFDENETAWAPTATIGYRVQTRRNFLRAGVTSPAPRPKGPARSVTLGVSFGRAF